MNKKIIFANTNNIEDYDTIARKFVKDMFDLNYDECFISDDSWLSDFSSCGMPDEFDSTNMTLDEVYTAWDQFIAEKIKAAYGIALDMTKPVVLVELFEQIRQDSMRVRS
jgi:hypothetical protein